MNKLVFSILALSTLISCVASADNELEFLDQVIHSEQLSAYWHVEDIPGRSPLVVTVPADLEIGNTKLEKFGKPVIVTHAAPKDNVAFSIDKITKDDSRMEMDFSYPPEGLHGVAIFHKIKGKWQLEKLDVFES